jgi:hypothetical protein
MIEAWDREDDLSRIESWVGTVGEYQPRTYDEQAKS